MPTASGVHIRRAAAASAKRLFELRITLRVALRASLAVTIVAAWMSSTRLTAQAPTVPAVSVAHDSFTVVSKFVGEPRLINVHVPQAYAASPTVKFPVLYMPDGGMDEDFPHIVKTVDSLIATGDIRPVIVVGIPNTERRRDLTGPTRIASDSAIAKRVGESAAFRRFVRDELFPQIDKRYRTSAERSVVGESLAGLFVVETMLRQPDMFSHYIALDPSLWWNAGALADSSSQLIKRFDSNARTLYLANSDIKEMADGIRKLDRALQASPPRNFRWKYVERLDLTHATIFLGLQVEALIHALR